MRAYLGEEVLQHSILADRPAVIELVDFVLEEGLKECQREM